MYIILYIRVLTPLLLYIKKNYSASLRRLPAEELEKKRREMMDFAREREVERENNVQRYKRQEEQEKARDDAKQDRHAGFIQWVFKSLKSEFVAVNTHSSFL